MVNQHNMEERIDILGERGYHFGEGADLLTLQEVSELLKVSKAYIYIADSFEEDPAHKDDGTPSVQTQRYR